MKIKRVWSLSSFIVNGCVIGNVSLSVSDLQEVGSGTSYETRSFYIPLVRLSFCDKKARLPVAFIFLTTENRKNPEEESYRNGHGEYLNYKLLG